MRLDAAFLFLFAAMVPAAILAQDGILLAEESLGYVPIEGDFRRIVVSHVKGSVHVQLGETVDEVSFSSFTNDGKRDPLPIGVWSDGTTLRFAPSSGAASQPYALQVSVPEGFDVMLDLEGTQVTASALPNGLEVHGKELALRVGGVRGRAVFELLGGVAVLGGVGKSLEVRGKGVDLQIGDMRADVTLHLAGGKARISGVGGSIEGDTDGTALSVQDSGPVSVTAVGGRIDLVNVARAELILTGAPLTLSRVRGASTIRSDAGVRFTDTLASVRLDGTGGAVHGSRGSGAIEIKTRDAEVGLEHMVGPVRVEGEGLGLRLNDILGEIVVVTGSSDVDVTGTQEPLTIDNQGGSVTVRDARAPVTVRAVGGTVALLDLSSSVELHADVGDVDVSFTVLPSDKDSVLENVGGGLHVRFPEGGNCRVEARSRGGRIESAFEHVVIDTEGTSATGLIGGGGGRTIRMDAGWNIQLTGAELSGSPR